MTSMGSKLLGSCNYLGPALMVVGCQSGVYEPVGELVGEDEVETQPLSGSPRGTSTPERLLDRDDPSARDTSGATQIAEAADLDVSLDTSVEKDAGVDSGLDCSNRLDGSRCGTYPEICLNGACRLSRCGDAYVDPIGNEECDDGNVVHSDGCENDCSRTRVLQMGAGNTFSCALLSAGSVKCWGGDIEGHLGRGTEGQDIGTPKSIEPLDFGNGLRVTQLTVGRNNVCVVFENRRGRCWGSNQDGQLGLGHVEHWGDNASESLASLADLPIFPLMQLSVARRGICAVREVTPPSVAGTVHCWGEGSRSELGNGDTSSFGDDEAISSDRPVTLPELATSIATGDLGSCAILVTGAVHCWGESSRSGVDGVEYFIGDGFEPGATASIPVVGLNGGAAATLASWGQFTVLKTSSNRLYSWGDNRLSKAGHPLSLMGENVPTATPIELGGIPASAVAVANSQACFLDLAGRVRCWGKRGPFLGYALGAPVSEPGFGDILTPGQWYAADGNNGAIDLGDFDGVEGPDLATSISLGLHHSCAIMVGGSLRCWGQNESVGALGYGLTIEDIGDNETPAEFYSKQGFADVEL